MGVVGTPIPSSQLDVELKPVVGEFLEVIDGLLVVVFL
jgi:hypothetical protein